MPIVVIPVGRLKQYVDGQEQIRLEFGGQSVLEILEGLRIPSALVAAVLVDGTLVTKDHIPQDADTVKLISVLGGG